jgi:anhydro-N-acetylmuramic acid kinase
MEAKTHQLYIGLMTGTSVDGIDAAIVEFGGEQTKTVCTHSHEIPEELRQMLHALCTPGGDEIERMGVADAWLGEVLAEATNKLLEKAKVDKSLIRAIGCHGQTIRHRPNQKYPFTLQIGDSNRVAELTGITVVGDLRRRDIAAGG